MSEKKKCFIITPIGPDNSEIRREIEGIIDEVINPILEEMGYEENNVAHRKNSSSSIPSDVIKSIYESDLCIANLSGNNPNVMYELALRHAAGKHVIIITNDITSLPFDINVQRSIEYKNDMQGALDLKKDLRKKIKYIEENPSEISNPIYDNLSKVLITDDSIPNISMDYKESLEKIMKDIGELKILTKQEQIKRNKLDIMNYRSLFKEHDNKLRVLERRLRIYKREGEKEKLEKYRIELIGYINHLEKEIIENSGYEIEQIYNNLCSEAYDLLFQYE